MSHTLSTVTSLESINKLTSREQAAKRNTCRAIVLFQSLEHVSREVLDSYDRCARALDAVQSCARCGSTDPKTRCVTCTKGCFGCEACVLHPQQEVRAKFPIAGRHGNKCALSGCRGEALHAPAVIPTFDNLFSKVSESQSTMAHALQSEDARWSDTKFKLHEARREVRQTTTLQAEHPAPVDRATQDAPDNHALDVVHDDADVAMQLTDELLDDVDELLEELEAVEPADKDVMEKAQEAVQEDVHEDALEEDDDESMLPLPVAPAMTMPPIAEFLDKHNVPNYDDSATETCDTPLKAGSKRKAPHIISEEEKQLRKQKYLETRKKTASIKAEFPQLKRKADAMSAFMEGVDKFMRVNGFVQSDLEPYLAPKCMEWLQ